MGNWCGVVDCDFFHKIEEEEGNQGRKYPVVLMKMERILNRKVGVSGRGSAFYKQI